MTTAALSANPPAQTFFRQDEMTSEPTHSQSPLDRRRASELSQQRTQPPTEVPGYEPQRFLGSGAYGEVWVAVDRNTGRQVAIKFFEHRAGINWSLLSREVEKLVFLSADRYVVQLLDVGRDSDPPYYVMEYIENGSLDDRLRTRGTLPVREAVDMFRDVVIGVSHAHAKGVLHCDLKPANVLLDQDEKPRIADFGQSRMTSEQAPALGTLFYMPPEQACLDALPDARWDVYALGALLYCMVKGHPPHRTGEAVSEIDSSTSLLGRLEKYRQYIRQAPPVTDHRKLAGVDRSLSEIIERCLSVDPDERFETVPSMLQALDERDTARVRRPLQILGIIGPLLLLLTTGVFGFRAYKQAIMKSEDLARASAQQLNQFAANVEARNVAGELRQRFQAVEAVAGRDELARLVREFTSDIRARELLATLSDNTTAETVDKKVKDEFVWLPSRKALQDYMDGLMRRPPSVASWFVTDVKGTMLAWAGRGGKLRIGDNFSYRTYFHGGLNDDEQRVPRQPLQSIYLSAPFLSTATNTYKAAISAPIQVKPENETLGVLVVTLELGEFLDVVEATKDLCAVLIDGRKNKFAGMIFQHPLYGQLLDRHEKLPIELKDYRVDVNELTNGEAAFYTDPLGKHELGETYAGVWIASTAPVKVPLQPHGDYDTGLLLTVQRRFSSATEPVARLSRTLSGEGVAALAIVVVVSVMLWYLVLRMMRESFQSSRRGVSAGDSADAAATSVHSRETLEMPMSKSS